MTRSKRPVQGSVRVPLDVLDCDAAVGGVAAGQVQDLHAGLQLQQPTQQLGVGVAALVAQRPGVEVEAALVEQSPMSKLGSSTRFLPGRPAACGDLGRPRPSPPGDSPTVGAAMHQPERPCCAKESLLGAASYFCGDPERRPAMMSGRTRRHRSRAVLMALAAASAIALLPASPAAAHVHGITPLRCVGTADDGANQTDTTPASAANGGPISGLIPRDVGNAPLTVGDGGFDTPACPASP